jgi:hypothetical protein
VSDKKIRRGKTISLHNGISSCFNSVSIKYKRSFSLKGDWEEIASEKVLKHTDNIIYDKKNDSEIVVFVDSAQWAAELNMQKEFYRILLSKKTGKQIASVKFFVSKNTSIRKNFEKLEQDKIDSELDTVIPLSMTDEEEYFARLLVDDIEDDILKEKVFNALKADFEWKKGIAGSKKS